MPPIDQSSDLSCADKRRQRLKDLKQAASIAVPDSHANQSLLPNSDEAGPIHQGQELNVFIKQLVSRKQERKHQLQIIQEFFENPLKFGVQTEFVPHSSTMEEIKEKKDELQYRIDLLRSVLKALEGEMELLRQAEKSTL